MNQTAPGGKRADRRRQDQPQPDSTEPIDIDDAAIDEDAVVDPDESLVENSKTNDSRGGWKERDANRRAHGPDDLKD